MLWAFTSVSIFVLPAFVVLYAFFEIFMQRYLIYSDFYKVVYVQTDLKHDALGLTALLTGIKPLRRWIALLIHFLRKVSPSPTFSVCVVYLIPAAGEQVVLLVTMSKVQTTWFLSLIAYYSQPGHVLSANLKYLSRVVWNKAVCVCIESVSVEVCEASSQFVVSSPLQHFQQMVVSFSHLTSKWRRLFFRPQSSGDFSMCAPVCVCLCVSVCVKPPTFPF